MKIILLGDNVTVIYEGEATGEHYDICIETGECLGIEPEPYSLPLYLSCGRGEGKIYSSCQIYNGYHKSITYI